MNWEWGSDLLIVSMILSEKSATFRDHALMPGRRLVAARIRTVRAGGIVYGSTRFRAFVADAGKYDDRSGRPGGGLFSAACRAPRRK